MMNITRDFSKCPRCDARTKKAIAFSGGDSKYWYKCTECNTYINTYVPMAHQEKLHRDPRQYVGNFGGYGSGKTTTSQQEFYKHLFITPNGVTLIGARNTAQYEQTIRKDIETDIPDAFIKDYSIQKSYLDFINGHRLIFRPFDDEGKLRSYNTTMCIVVEASEVAGEIYAQLKTRNRNLAAGVVERDAKGRPMNTKSKQGVLIPKMKADWRKILIESNPDAGWIRTEVLLTSSEIIKSGGVIDVIATLKEQEDPQTASYITATDANVFLPPTFIADNSRNKPVWWVSRFLKGSFSYAEGLVYPSAMQHIIPAFEIPHHFPRLVAFDYGLHDDAVFLYAAIDVDTGTVYIYNEQRTNNTNIEELSSMYFKGISDIPSGLMIGAPIIDPKSGPKRDYDKKSLADHFLEHGIAFRPGVISVDARVYRLNTYFEAGRVKIMDNCTGLIMELRDYKFPEQKLDRPVANKPMDKNNHGINPLEWIVCDLPSDPRNLVRGVYDRMGREITKVTRAEAEPLWQLADTEDTFDNTSGLYF